MSRNSLVQAQRPGPGTLLPITQQGRAQVAAQVFPDMLPAGCCTERSGTRRGRDEGSQEDIQSGGLRRTESAGRYSLIQTADPHGSTAGSLLTLQLWADSAPSRPVQITDLPPPMSTFSVSREWGWGSSGHLFRTQVLLLACDSRSCFSWGFSSWRGAMGGEQCLCGPIFFKAPQGFRILH